MPPSVSTTVTHAPEEVLVLSLEDLDQDFTIPAKRDDDHKAPMPASRSKLYLMVLADFGLSFTWLCKFAVATPYFEHSLKSGVFLSHLVWIMGPLSGLIVAPLVGVLSDRCTSSFGRRRPFMLGGTICCILGMNVFANAAKLTLGNLFAARLLAVLAFGVLDFSTNAIMFPSRALLGDLLPADQQHAVQSAAAVVASIAEICAGAYITSWKNPVTHVARIFLVASVLLALSCVVSLVVCKEQPLRSIPPTSPSSGPPLQTSPRSSGQIEHVDEQRRSLVASHQLSNFTVDDEEEEEEAELGLAGTQSQQNEGDGGDRGAISKARSLTDAKNESNAPEAPAKPGRESGPGASNGDLRDSQLALDASKQSWRSELISSIRTAIQNFPRPLVKVGVVYGLAWFLWFASLPYYSQWLGTDVLNGDPHAEPGTAAANAYQRGVAVFSIANVAKAILAMVFSAFYPTIIKWVGAIGERVVFGASFLVFSSVLFSCATTTNVLIAGAVIALGSVPFIVTQTIPIAIVVQRYPENLASNLGVLNLFCVVPQLIDTLYTGKVAELAGESVVLKVAACWGFVASVAAFLCL